MGYILTDGTSILTNYAYDDSLGYYVDTAILSCDKIPSSCPLLDSKKYSVWDITFFINSTQWQGEDICMPYYIVPFRMNWYYSQFDNSQIGYDYVENAEVLEHSQNNARILDYVNGEIYGPEYTNYGSYGSNGGEITAGGYTGGQPYFCKVIYDHAPGYFTPENNELAAWNISYKIRIYFNAEVSIAMLRKAIEYGVKYPKYSGDDALPEYPYIDSGIEHDGHKHFPGTKVEYKFEPVKEDTSTPGDQM